MVALSRRWAIVSCVSAVGLLLIFVLLSFANRSAESINSQNIFGSETYKCVESLSSKQKSEQLDLQNHEKIVELCYKMLFGISTLNDFQVRKLKFSQQQYDEIIMLWMVVVITLSGVVLAGVQLAASYRLASNTGSILPEDTTHLTVERDRLVFKSSITGLAILVISFAFFLVFVLEIYTIREVGVSNKTSAYASSSEEKTIERQQNGYGNGEKSK